MTAPARLVGYRWGLSEDTVRLEAAFRVSTGGPGCAPGRLLGQRICHGLQAAAAGVRQPRGSVSCTPSPGDPR